MPETYSKQNNHHFLFKRKYGLPKWNRYFFLRLLGFLYKKRDLPFLSAFFIMSSTCALVGFWPRALSMEPSSSTDMVPSLFLSNISKHSISSTQKEREKSTRTRISVWLKILHFKKYYRGHSLHWYNFQTGNMYYIFGVIG